MSLVSQEFAGAGLGGSLPALPAAGNASAAGSPRYETAPTWMARRWESAETDDLNSAHWLYAADESLNAWLASQLPILRGRGIYETKNNPTILGMIATHADDIVGPDGPTLQVQSDDDTSNKALESLWQDWFYAPTHLPHFSGAALLKGWIKSLWKCGALLGRIYTDEAVDTPIRMRIRPLHPRRLGTPAELAGNPRVFMGVEYDLDGRPLRYWITRQQGIGTSSTSASTAFDPVPAELVVHEFIREEEDQGVGVPWLAPSLQPAADLRDYDDQVQDGARQMADNSALLYTDSPSVTPITDMPESTTVKRRSIRMAPPGWKPWNYQASQPPVQYTDYRGEKHADFGRPVGMPKLMVRMDASKHSWASARMDISGYIRAGSSFQTWLSGSEKSAGTLNRLVDELAREGRFVVKALRNRPPVVRYHWGWPQIDPVEPDKQASADETSLRTRTRTLTEILASRKKTLAMHVQELRREEEAFEEAEVAKPQWMTGQQAAPGQPPAGAAAGDTTDSDTLQAIEEAKGNA